MGGNSKAIDRDTGEILAFAEPLDLRTFSRKQFIKDFTDLLIEIDIFDTYPCNKHGDFLALSNELFSGSSSHLFDPKIKEKELLKHKPVFGDIDIMIPKECREQLCAKLQSLEGKQLTSWFRYIGQDRDSFGHTFLCIFEYVQGVNKIDLQIDFEFADFLNGMPTEWAKFSHSSSWEDIRNGLRGFHHKAILTNLYRAISRLENAKLCTPTSNFHKHVFVSGKKAESVPRMLAFSVDRGLREKYEYILNPITNDVICKEGKKLIKEILPENSTYTKDIRKLFDIAFPYASHLDYKKFFFSAVGILELVNAFFDKETKNALFTYCLQMSMFGIAQRIDKNDWENDKAIKMKLGTYLGQSLEIKKYRTRLQEASKLYYEK